MFYDLWSKSLSNEDILIIYSYCVNTVSSPMTAKSNVSTLEAKVKQANRYIDTPKKSM